MRKLYFVAGLPRSGSTLLITLLGQNPEIHGEAVSNLYSIFTALNYAWDKFDTGQEYYNLPAKKNSLKAVLENYHDTQRQIIFDKDRLWIRHIGLLEALFQKEVKVLVPVRNPAEILASYEKIRKTNPFYVTLADNTLKEESSIPGRALFYSGPSGFLGTSYQATKDAVTEGYLDRMIFVDYNRFCNTPKAQMKRIYDFFELSNFEHDFQNIKQTEVYNNLTTRLPDCHKIKSSIQRTVVNPVEYLGLDLYQQYNREIFWDAWI